MSRRAQRRHRALSRRVRLRRTLAAAGVFVLAATGVALAVSGDGQSSAATPTPTSSTGGQNVVLASSAATASSSESPTAMPSAPTSPSASPSPSVVASPPAKGNGRYAVVAWPAVKATSGSGRVVRVGLEIEGGLGVDAAATAAKVAKVLQDPRGWEGEENVRFSFPAKTAVEAGKVDVRIILASKTSTMQLCGPVKTGGFTSCYNGKVVLNLDRWMLAVDAYKGHLDDYRTYVVNHEVGHALGHGHVGCPKKGTPAPIMVPQTLHLYGCTPNQYPTLP